MFSSCFNTNVSRFNQLFCSYLSIKLLFCLMASSKIRQAGRTGGLSIIVMANHLVSLQTFTVIFHRAGIIELDRKNGNALESI